MVEFMDHDAFNPTSPNAELNGMAGAEDRKVWERRPFPLERLVRDARVSASQFCIVMRKTSRASEASCRFLISYPVQCRNDFA